MHKTAVAAMFVVALAGCNNSQKEPPPVAKADKTACLTDKAMHDKYAAHIANGDHWKAAMSLALCVEKTGDKALTAKMHAAETTSRETDANNTSLPAQDRLNAIGHLRRLSPEKADKYGKLEKALSDDIKKAEAEAKRRDLAERKKKGVHIGMTPDDVLLSNWGKPAKVNRTTTASGTSEQWVYGGGNYLYFRNGKLETIQN